MSSKIISIIINYGHHNIIAIIQLDFLEWDNNRLAQRLFISLNDVLYCLSIWELYLYICS